MQALSKSRRSANHAGVIVNMFWRLPSLIALILFRCRIKLFLPSIGMLISPHSFDLHSSSSTYVKVTLRTLQHTVPQVVHAFTYTVHTPPSTFGDSSHTSQRAPLRAV